MPEKLGGLRKRLAKLEQTVANIAKEEDLANCICRKVTMAIDHRPEEFEAEMNQTCPAHGLRSLGKIVHVRFIARGQEGAKLEQLIEMYKARRRSTKLDLSRVRQFARELQHDSQEP